MITHIVLFQPKAGVTPAQKQDLADAVQLACTQAASVRRFEIARVIDAGAGYSKQFGEKTYEYVAVIEFDDRQGLAEYLNHPAHERLAKLFWEACEATRIIDAETMTSVG